MDVDTAFLNGEVKSEVYVRAPKGYETGVRRVCILQKALYGLRESPRQWYETFNDFLVKMKFVRSNYDHCLYEKNSNKDPMYTLIFVDDLLICSKNKVEIEEVKSGMMNRFAMQDMGEIKSYIGMNAIYNKNLWPRRTILKIRSCLILLWRLI